MIELKLVPVDDELGLPLPTETLTKLGLQEGDTVYLLETTDGFQLSIEPPTQG